MPMILLIRISRILLALALAFVSLLAFSLAARPMRAQEQTFKHFAETNQTVSGRFLRYWEAHGALAQQGFPISPEFREKSDLNGKSYTVQYFERAVFEYHPENQPPNDVLLSQLGTFLYQQKYPYGAPGQVVNSSAGSMLFAQTGHRVGGGFLDYWKSHGALAQQGDHLSEES